MSRLTRLLEKQVADGRSTPGLAQKIVVPVVVWKKDASRRKNEKQ